MRATLHRRVFIATLLAITACAWIVLAAALAAPFWPRPRAVWSWEDRARAVVAAGLGITAALALSWLSVRVWRNTVRTPVRALILALLLLTLTTASAYTVLRSGTLLPDIRAEIRAEIVVDER